MGITTKKSEVIVIGSGVAGLSTAYHLRRKHGIRGIQVLSAPETTATESAAGWVTGGQPDNFTRLSHAHGGAAAAALWRFGDQAFMQTIAFAQELGVKAVRGPRERLIVSEHELNEAKHAVEELQRHHFQVTLSRDPAAQFLTSRSLARQLESNGGGFIEPLELRAALNREAGLAVEDCKIVQVAETAAGMTAIDEKNNKYQCEVLVLACHLGARKLLPDLAEAFVPVAEQWVELEYDTSSSVPTGYTFSANHGYEWGVFTEPRRCRIGGGRFLRKLAGIGWEDAPVDDSISGFLKKQLEATFADLQVKAVHRVVAGLDCRPCDELPIVGPMFGGSRILIAGGFMGLGLTQGFFAGRCLAKLIASGQAEELPRLIYPERLRSL